MDKEKEATLSNILSSIFNYFQSQPMLVIYKPSNNARMSIDMLSKSRCTAHIVYQ